VESDKFISLGKVDPGSVTKVVKEITVEEEGRQERIKNKPLLREILNLHDFEV
jgi:L-lactate dehydrogenase (cytochrome)